MRLTQALYDEITSHAVETFPHECCGLIVERGGNVRVIRVTNIQNERHAEDPERFPRTAEIAFTMGAEATPELIDHERGRSVIRAFYHSHPQHAAYFSAEDKKQATVWDEPSFPDAAQIVVSVFDRQVKDVKAFRWDDRQRDFLEVAFSVGEA
jgi:[CysO sulfur-carrier protein]-S-L-cysteine hydrolase